MREERVVVDRVCVGMLGFILTATASEHYIPFSEQNDDVVLD